MGMRTRLTASILGFVGATNRPQELDEAARRRFVKRLYIPLPSLEARLDLVSRLLKNNKNDLTDENMAFIADSTKGLLWCAIAACIRTDSGCGVLTCFNNRIFGCRCAGTLHGGCDGSDPELRRYPHDGCRLCSSY